MVRLCDRVMELVERSPRTAFDKTDIAGKLRFKSTQNVSVALGMLFQQDRINRIAPGCKNAQGSDSAPALYVRK